MNYVYRHSVHTCARRLSVGIALLVLLGAANGETLDAQVGSADVFFTEITQNELKSTADKVSRVHMALEFPQGADSQSISYTFTLDTNFSNADVQLRCAEWGGSGPIIATIPIGDGRLTSASANLLVEGALHASDIILPATSSGCPMEIVGLGDLHQALHARRIYVTLISDTGEELRGTPTALGGTISPFVAREETQSVASGDQAGGPSACHVLSASQAVPQGFGTAYNVFSASHELLIRVSCADDAAMVSLGNDSNDMYIYHVGYHWTGDAWEEIPFAGERFATDEWLVGTASMYLADGLQTNERNWIVAYMCQRERAFGAWSWKCGCADRGCAVPKWQLQGFDL